MWRRPIFLVRRWYSTQVIDKRFAPADFPWKDLHVFPDVLNAAEQSLLVTLAKKRLRRLPFETSHVDNVITGYRESRMSDPLRFLTDDEDKRVAEEALQRVKTLVHSVAVQEKEQDDIHWLPWHVIELLGETSIDASSAAYKHVSASSAVGIGAHVDHPHQSGRVIAALSLLHPAVIRFRKAKAANLAEYVDVLAMPGSVYIQK